MIVVNIRTIRTICGICGQCWAPCIIVCTARTVCHALEYIGRHCGSQREEESIGRCCVDHKGLEVASWFSATHICTAFYRIWLHYALEAKFGIDLKMNEQYGFCGPLVQFWASWYLGGQEFGCKRLLIGYISLMVHFIIILHLLEPLWSWWLVFLQNSSNPHNPQVIWKITYECCTNNSKKDPQMR